MHVYERNGLPIFCLSKMLFIHSKTDLVWPFLFHSHSLSRSLPVFLSPSPCRWWVYCMRVVDDNFSENCCCQHNWCAYGLQIQLKNASHRFQHWTSHSVCEVIFWIQWRKKNRCRSELFEEQTLSVDVGWLAGCFFYSFFVISKNLFYH